MKKNRQNRNHDFSFETKIEKMKKHDSRNAQIVEFFNENVQQQIQKK